MASALATALLLKPREGINRESPGLGWAGREPVLVSSSLAQSHLPGFRPINMTDKGPRLYLALHISPLSAESIPT